MGGSNRTNREAKQREEFRDKVIEAIKAMPDVDQQDLTTAEAMDRLVSGGQGYINKAGASALLAAAIGNYCPWDESRIH
jgi:hypothetical protein